MTKLLQVLPLLGLSASSAKAYEGRHEPPLGLTLQRRGKVVPSSQLERTDVDPVDVAKAQQEDEERAKANPYGPTRISLPREVDIDVRNDGNWENVDEVVDQLGIAWIWRHKFHTSDCTSLSFQADEFYLPMGAKLHIYDEDSGELLGRPLSWMDNNENNKIHTPIIHSCDVVLEIDLDDTSDPEDVVLVITEVDVGYVDFGSPPQADGSGRNLADPCNVDVVCPEANGWGAQINAVGAMAFGLGIGGQGFCTGFMVNNVKQDKTPFFITAEHCGVTNNFQAGQLVVYWNYQKTTCGGPRNGRTDQFTIGAQHLVSYKPSDVTLLRLTGLILNSWQVSYAGWDATGAIASSATGIHHPAVHEKSISHEFQPTSHTPNLLEQFSTGLTHIRVGDWDIGTTERGSSGSPLFDQNKRVIGQLHYGSSGCVSNTESLGDDGYGRFSVSFHDGDLKKYLDPDNTGAKILNTLSSGGGGGPPPPPPPPPLPPSPPSCSTACGNCDKVRTSKGCSCGACKTAVCKVDSFCCNTLWDQVCVTIAESTCTNCPNYAPPATPAPTTPSPTPAPIAAVSCAPNACTTESSSPGCAECQSCQQKVCSIDWFCCWTGGAWDSLCTGAAADVCETAEPSCPDACLVAKDTPGCESCPQCQAAVCYWDSFCCQNAWDEVCVSNAPFDCAGL